MRLFVLFFITLWLTSCTIAPTELQTAQNKYATWSNRAKTLNQIHTWNLTGLIAIRERNNAWSANLQWQQQQQNYHIRLFGPLGTHTYELSGDASHVILATPEGKQFSATTPEELLAQQLGWRIPVSYLLYWVRGLPAPTLVAEKSFDTYHHLTELKQAGWTIHYLRYTSANHIDMPSKIFLDNTKLNVKIIVNKWQI